MVCIDGGARYDKKVIESVHQTRETTSDVASDTINPKLAPSKKSQHDERKEAVFCKSPTKSVSRYIA
jgi:hypothetical protein